MRSKVERLMQQAGSLTETDVRHLYGLVIQGQPSPTPCRDGQNVIQGGLSGTIVYLPPEAHCVPSLTAELIAWVNDELTRGGL